MSWWKVETERYSISYVIISSTLTYRTAYTAIEINALNSSHNPVRQLRYVFHLNPADERQQLPLFHIIGLTLLYLPIWNWTLRSQIIKKVF